MKCLNQPIAREANKEDNCTGHFWESRFKSDPLLTEEAILSCMAYVDLNPVRAKIADTPEESAHTSIKERLKPEFDLSTAVQEQVDQQVLRTFTLPLKPLAKFEGTVNGAYQSGILFDFEDYLELVDTTGRIIREGKRGAISISLPPILQRLNIDLDTWLKNCTQFEKNYYAQFYRRSDRFRVAA